MKPNVSIIICTRNRAADLRKTLQDFAQLDVSETLYSELIVVDNASTDDTKQVACASDLRNMPVRWIYEARPGKSYALNTGLMAAQGNVILFTDDDVRPPQDWIAGMCRPFISNEAQVVAGRIEIAPHLQRAWMKSIHRMWLASTELDASQPQPLTAGANLGFLREVLSKVPAFDTELGPGALGFGEEVLFQRQLHQCGYHAVALPHVAVEHHFHPDRLGRRSFLSAAAKHGRTAAYIAYHWEHHPVANPRLQALKCRLRVHSNRLKYRRECRESEGMPEWEMLKLQGASFYQHFYEESKRPRNYEKFGLVKRIYA